jgi:uncharacterized protein (DUF885 family)
MRTRLSPFSFFVVFAAFSGLASCQPAAPSAPPTTGSIASASSTSNAPAAGSVAELSKRYLDGLFRAKPHLATFAGDHRFDGALPDVSPEAMQHRDEELAALAKEVAAAHPTTPDDEADAQILKDGIALERLYIAEIRDWEWDPRLYDSFPYYDPREIVAGRMSDILHGDFAPEAERRKSVTAQLGALPKFLAQMKAGLAHPKGARRTPKVYLDQGVKDNAGRIEFFETEVKDFTKSDAAAEAARVTAVAALRDYQTFLEKELAPQANGDWRLGAPLYEKKFSLALQTDRTPKEAVASAEKSFQAARTELVALARKLAAKTWPTDKSDATDVALVNRVKEELSKHHPAPADLVNAHGKNLDQMRAFIQEHDMLGLPPRETLGVEPMPLFKRGSSAAEYLAPGVLERRPSFKATYFVDPIDPAWPADKVESYLRGQNDYEVQLIAMHEAYPGHHTQFFYSRQNLDPVRAVLWNAAMVEGWAVYAEGQMVQNGWGGADNDRYRFYDLRGQMISCANTILDVKLQSGLMTDEEAVRFMVEDGFQERAMAEKKLLRAKLDSTQLAQYFLGLDEIRTFEKEYREKHGAKVTQRAFNEAVIGHGSIAVKLLRRWDK